MRKFFPLSTFSILIVFSVLCITCSFNFVPSARNVLRSVIGKNFVPNNLKLLLTSPNVRETQLYGRNHRKADNEEEEEAKWDDDLDGKNNEMIIRSEDDVIETNEWSSKTTPIEGTQGLILFTVR